MEQVEQLQARVVQDLGNEDSRWFDPAGYSSVALCVLDSIYSIGVRYTGVINFLERYRKLREVDTYEDTPADLINAIQAAGGPQGFAQATSCQWRTSTRSGILKAEAVEMAARILDEAGLTTVPQLRMALGDVESQKNSSVKKQWTSIPGQGSGLSWNYFLMLAKIPGVKADRMILRYVSSALDRPVGSEEAARLVMGVAEDMGIDPIKLDHAIWRKESGREIYVDPEVQSNLATESN